MRSGFSSFFSEQNQMAHTQRRKDNDITSGSKTMVLFGRLFVGLKEPRHLITS